MGDQRMPDEHLQAMIPDGLTLRAIPEQDDPAFPVLSARTHSPSAKPGPAEKNPEALSQPAALRKQATRGRVVGLKGAVITYQDGIIVKYRKKCIVCGFEADGCHTMLIRKGVTTAVFYCPKCRLTRGVQIQGPPN